MRSDSTATRLQKSRLVVAMRKMGVEMPRWVAEGATLEDLRIMAAIITKAAARNLSGEASPPPDPTGFRDELRRLRAAKGDPSTRKISAEMTGVGHNTIASALSGQRIPSWAVALRLTEYLGGDREKMRELWLQAKGKKA